MKKSLRKILVVSLSIALICTSAIASFAEERTQDATAVQQDPQTKEILSLVKAYTNQQQRVLTIGENKIEKIDVSKPSKVKMGGITKEQKENANVYLIENKTSKSCYMEVPVAVNEDSSGIMPMAAGSRSQEKNYARINAIATIKFDTYTNKNTGYKPTHTGGRISYLPNSAQITSLKTKCTALGAYITRAGGTGVQAPAITKTFTLDVNKYSTPQLKNVSTAYGSKYFVTGTTATDVASRLTVKYKLNGGSTSGTFYVQVEL